MKKNYSLLRPDFSMWREALRGIPRVKDKAHWDALDPVSRWFISTRAAVLLMTLFAAIIAGIYAQIEGAFDWLRFAAVAFGLVMAHATNNILNDLADHRRGVDKDNAFRTQYGTQPVEHGFMTQGQSKMMALITGIVGGLAGIWLVIGSDPLVLYFFLAGIVFLFAYKIGRAHV